MYSLDAVPVKVDDGGAVVALLCVAQAGFAVDLRAGLEGCDEECADGVAGGSWEGDVGCSGGDSITISCISWRGEKEEKIYPGRSSEIQKSAGSPGSAPKPTELSWRPMKRYPRGWRQARKKVVDVERCETVRVRWERGILAARSDVVVKP